MKKRVKLSIMVRFPWLLKMGFTDCEITDLIQRLFAIDRFYN